MIDLDQLERLAKAAPSGQWEVWTSNSWRRVYANQGREQVRVIEPVVQRTDNHPDLWFGQGVAEYLEGVTPDAILELVAEVRRLREDKARLDSGCIMRTDWDDCGDTIKIESRGNNLRQMIDEAMAVADKEKA
jgi:hypothetical protein